MHISRELVEYKIVEDPENYLRETFKQNRWGCIFFVIRFKQII